MNLKFIALIVLFVFSKSGVQSQNMKKQFEEDRKAEIRHLDLSSLEILTEEKLSTVPKAIQNHLRSCGFVGKPLAMNADVIWSESYIKLKPGQKFKPLLTQQFNNVNPIMRTALMRVRGMFFVGKDLYKEGDGTMKGKILNLFSVINAKGEEISQSALITSFCEMMLLSGYAFQDYIQWEAIDDYTVKGTLIDHNMEVTGIFHFAENGRFAYFESEDRFFTLEDGSYEKRKFRAEVNSYKKVKDHYQPEEVNVAWILDDGPYIYFKGIIKEIHFNVQ